MKKRVLAALLAVCIVMTVVTGMAFAVGNDYSDVDGHWAEEAIERWSAYGVVQGNNGKFMPNDGLTRGQLAVIIANLLNLPIAPSAGFSDVGDTWYTDAINSCFAAGIMLGADGKARPNDPISREETVVMLARALGVKPAENTSSLDKFADDHKVSSWAEGYVAAMTEEGIVGGFDGKLMPEAEIDRASTITILHNAISTYADQPGQVVNAEGDGIVLVAAPNVTVTGEADGVVVAQGAADGTTTLTNMKVNGDVAVAAEGADVVLNGVSSAESVTVTEQAKDASVDVGAAAEVGTVETKAENSAINVSGTVENVNVSDTASNVTVEANSGSTITNVETKAEGTTVAGTGTVENVTTSGDNTTVQTGGTKVEAAVGTTGTTAGGQTVTGGTSSTTTPGSGTSSGGGSTGGGSVVMPPVHIHIYGSWTSNEDGTHTGTCSCNDTSKENCTYTAGVCSKCGYADGAVAKIGSTYFTTLQAAVDAAKDGETVTVLKGIQLSERINIIDKSLTLDLNGKTIYTVDGYTVKYVIYIDNSLAAEKTVTIKNGTVEAATNTAERTIHPYSRNDQVEGEKLVLNLENVTIKNTRTDGVKSTLLAQRNVTVNVKAGTVIESNGTYCTVEMGYGAVMNMYNGSTVKHTSGSATNALNAALGAGMDSTINVYGGTVICDKYCVYALPSGSLINLINISAGTFTGEVMSHGATSKVVITGGDFTGNLTEDGGEIEITGGTFGADPSAYVAEGCEVTENDDTWTVSQSYSYDDATDTYTVYDAAGLKAAVAKGDNIKLGDNITVTEPLDMQKSYTLDFDRNTLYLCTTEVSYIYRNSNITFCNGTLDISGVNIPDTVKKGIFYTANGESGHADGNGAQGNTFTFDNMLLTGEGYNAYSVIMLRNGADDKPNVINFVNGSKIVLKDETCSAGGVFKGADSSYANVIYNITDSTINCSNITRLFLYGTVNVTNSTIDFIDSTGTSNAFRQGVFTIDSSKVTIKGGDKGISPRHGDTTIRNDSVVTIENVQRNDVIFEYDFDICVDSTSTFTYTSESGSAGGSVIFAE